MKRVSSLVYRPNVYCVSFFAAVVSLLAIHGCTADATHQQYQQKSEDFIDVHGHHGIKKTNVKTQPACSADDKACEKDRLGLEAIRTLHLLIDDDHNGNVDQSESDEFLRDELQYTDGFERQALFHNNDKLISVDDLWRAWKYSVVYNWTVEDVLEWLVHDVDLPQYSHSFHHHAIDGSYLPRLVNSTGSLLSTLGIRNPVHKQKLSLKAMDAVLFGAPKRVHSYVKDVLLVSSLIITFGGAWFTYLQHRYSKTQYKKMLVDLESLQKAEEALKKLSKELSEAEKNQKSIPPEKQEELMLLRKSSVRLKVPPVQKVNGDASPTLSRESSLIRRQEGERRLRQAEEELASLREALSEAESRLEEQQHLESQWSVPAELQAWLQMTHELELQHFTAKHQAAERQLLAAREGCDKIKKRNKAFFGSLRMAHSNSMDEIDQSLLDARAALEEVKQDLQERLHRWHTIEILCGFPIISNPGLSNLRQMLGRESPNGNTGRNMPGSMMAPASIEEAEEEMPPVDLSHCTSSAFLSSLQNGAPSSTTRPRALSAGYPALASGASKPFLKQTLTGSTGSLSHIGKVPLPGQAVLARKESHENVPQSSAHGAPTSSVSFHLGEGQSALHERSYSNASSVHHQPPITNGHHAHHQYPHQGQGHTHPRSNFAAYPQSYSYPPMKQSNVTGLQHPSSHAHLSAASSVGTFSTRLSSSQSSSSANLRPGLSSSNSNLANFNQKVSHSCVDPHHSEDQTAASSSPSQVQNPRVPNSLALNSVTYRGAGQANDSWEVESNDSSLQQQTSQSSDRPQLVRTPEFEDTTSLDSNSFVSPSKPATQNEKKHKKKKYMPSFLRKSSSKQKTT